MTTSVDQLLLPTWIVPIVPEGVVLTDHAIALKNDRIFAVLPAEQATQALDPAETIRLENQVLLPGLVNAHTHSAMTLMRGLADDRPLMNWLNDHIWPAEKRVLGPEYVEVGTELAVAEMIRGGTTCFNDMYFFPNVAAGVIKRTGIRAVLGFMAMEFATPWAENMDEYIDKALAMYDDIRHHPLLSATWAPHAPYTVGNKGFDRIKTLLDQMDIPLHTHLHETAQEIADSVAEHGIRPISRMQGLGLLNDAMIAVHMTQLTDQEIDLCARHAVGIVHCPESNMKLASGVCPVPQLLEAGVTMGLGTDGTASNNDLDMFGEMRAAAMLAKVASGKADALAASQVLRMATLGGARLLRLESECGSLEPGKAADIISVRMDRLETRPVYDVISHLVYVVSRRDVQNVWVAGRQLMRERELADMDTSEILRKALIWEQRVKGNDGEIEHA